MGQGKDYSLLSAFIFSILAPRSVRISSLLLDRQMSMDVLWSATRKC